ncbi:serine hydrolase [Actinorhabdospora filicis]|uniref:Serine hydrolase n=1 Tax=Actinorhabdospora filicis TaxID=1785913 RepID=A0A9W6SM67_9ACTN|nr:serine hydrolase domain-containing protein [Actinorhabdospora filicis]GLZ78798.1 serine hydrolase [Actinorhabdospora filicis]
MSQNGVLDSTARKLSHRLALAQSKGRIPSIVAGVVRSGELVWSAGRGRVEGAAPDVDTQYRIGSLTKSLVAVAVMRLRDEGLLDLSDRLEAFVPGTAVGDRTVGQLLSHSGGLPAELPGSWWERSPGVDSAELVRLMGDGVAVSWPGKGFHYSNPGFALLGELVSRVRGEEWTRVLAREVLEPLGMKRTTALPEGRAATGLAVHPWMDVVMPEAVQDTGAMGPAGQLWSTVADLARFASFLSGDTGGVLSADTVLEMAEPVGVSDGDEWVSGYGLGLQLWRAEGRRVIGHSGSMPGFLAGILVAPGADAGVVGLSNVTSSPDGFAFPDLLRIFVDAEPVFPQEWLPEEGADLSLLELAGPWYWGPGAFVIRVRREGWLELAPISRGRGSRFRPLGDGSWLGLDGYYAGERLVVVRDAVGGVSHLDVGTFVFTRVPYEGDGVPGGVVGGWR